MCVRKTKVRVLYSSELEFKCREDLSSKLSMVNSKIIFKSSVENEKLKKGSVISFLDKVSIEMYTEKGKIESFINMKYFEFRDINRSKIFYRKMLKEIEEKNSNLKYSEIVLIKVKGYFENISY